MIVTDVREVDLADWSATVEALRDEGYDYFDWFTAVDQTDAPEPGFDLVCHLLVGGRAAVAAARSCCAPVCPRGARRRR